MKGQDTNTYPSPLAHRRSRTFLVSVLLVAALATLGAAYAAAPRGSVGPLAVSGAPATLAAWHSLQLGFVSEFNSLIAGIYSLSRDHVSPYPAATYGLLGTIVLLMVTMIRRRTSNPYLIRRRG